MTATASEPARIQRLASALAAGLAARGRGERVSLPVVTSADAAALEAVMHAELDGVIAQRDAQIGGRMACGKGCSACCASPVLGAEGEAVAVAEWLREPAHADARAWFERAVKGWRERLGELAEQPRTTEAVPEWLARVQRRQAMCAFNHEGACSIYPVRPSMCRKAHALDTSANCASEDVPVQYYQHPETEELYEHQRPMQFALHRALRPEGSPALLCAAVHRVLGAATTERNAPCPCRSGKKYKKCCGA